MKRAVIGGFLALLGTIWGIGIMLCASGNLVSGWSTPPGRLLTTVAQMGMNFPLVMAGIFLVLGLAIMGVEFFRKD